MANANSVVEQPLKEHDDIETADFRQPPANPVANTMASEPGSPKYKKLSPQPNTTTTFLQHMTTIAHASILLFVILIIYFCFSEEWQFFTWHPFLLSIGWMFLMTEAILTISTENLFTGTLPKSVRVRLHWIFQAIGFVLIVIGFTVVFINKNYLNKSHFKSWHALFGFIGIVCSIPANLDGIAALYHRDLRNYIRPKINKFIHIVSGIGTFTFGGLSLVLSVYTNWFAMRSNGNIVTFGLALIFVVTAVVWTLIRPLKTSLGQMKHLY